MTSTTPSLSVTEDPGDQRPVPSTSGLDPPCSLSGNAQNTENTGFPIVDPAESPNLLFADAFSMSLTYIDADASARELSAALKGAPSIAVDCEAAGFHRYSDRLCLVQISTMEATFIVDPLAFDVSSYLKPALEDPATQILMHGAGYDLRLLRRDLGIRVTSLFDTQVVASLTGEPGVGLQALLEKYLGVRVSKKFQRADWARRPLTDEMIDYAASDTRHLHRLSDAVGQRLDETGRREWAREEFLMLESVADDLTPPEPVDPITRVKGAKDLDPRQSMALRAALDWRDEVARTLDRAPFRVSPDGALLVVAKDQPESLAGLKDVQGLSGRFVESHGENLLERLHHVRSLPEEDLVPFPRYQGGSPRPAPEIEARFERLKKVRNRYAEELGLDRGRIIANQLLMEIANREPSSPDELLQIQDLRTWQAELLGKDLLAVVKP